MHSKFRKQVQEGGKQKARRTLESKARFLITGAAGPAWARLATRPTRPAVAWCHRPRRGGLAEDGGRPSAAPDPASPIILATAVHHRRRGRSSWRPGTPTRMIHRSGAPARKASADHLGRPLGRKLDQELMSIRPREPGETSVPAMAERVGQSVVCDLIEKALPREVCGQGRARVLQVLSIVRERGASRSFTNCDVETGNKSSRRAGPTA